jgi:tetratricopeptide (TPR) repeat protein
MIKTLTTLREYLQHTEDALSAGRIEEALEHCEYVLSHFPKSLEAHRLLGEIYLAQNRLVEAQQIFDWVLTNDPENVLAYCNRALTSERMGDLDTALDCYQQAYELSRGNSQIRQEFNKLSERFGQQGFMLSRAGLARLYMRGGLLFQATQEWETVLTATPDRLDARTGLLETLWRDGNYEQAERVATSLLEEVPGCLKALLLLAHICYPHQPARARELLQRAEELDPEMIMARELFADLLAAHPDDPFLALVKKETVQVPPPLASASPRPSSPAPVAPAPEPEPAQEQIFGWTTPDPYPLTASPAGSESASLPAADRLSTRSATSWSPFSPTPSDEEQAASVEAGGGGHPSWLDSLEPLPRWQGAETLSANDAPSPVFEEPPTSTREQPRIEPFAAATFGETGPESAPQVEEEEPALFPYLDEESDPEMGWPEWLKSLGAETIEPAETSSPPRRSSATWGEDEPEPSVSSSAEAGTRADDGGRSFRREDPTARSQQSRPLEPAASAPIFSSEGEPYFPGTQPWGGLVQQVERSEKPSWLAELEGSRNLPEEALPASAAGTFTSGPPATPPTTPPATWGFEVSQQPADTPGLPWLEQLAAAPPSTPPPQPETASSWLEQLAAQGSRPAPQERREVEEHVVTTLEDLEQRLYAQGFVQLQPGELAAIARQSPPQPPEAPTATPAAAAPELEETVRASAGAGQPAQAVTPPAPGQEAEPLWPATPGPSRAQQVPPAAAPSSPGPALPGYRPDAFLEDELETTMKRPVFRLQPSQRPPASPLPSQERPVRRTREPAARSQEGEVSYKEHLIRGYQYQLAGAYDEAMQEYRLVIRNQPDLLGEVISNTRALLKLAPKYAPGYRVLGDAYMRQGEYLQAMEAYNKALAMTRRAKGQGSS